jgi:hypothetical protein
LPKWLIINGVSKNPTTTVTNSVIQLLMALIFKEGLYCWFIIIYTMDKRLSTLKY